MNRLLSPVFAPGFFTSAPVHTALAVGAAVATVSAVVGVFAVIRGQAFAGEALSDIGLTGGSAAFLIGVGPLWGFLASALAAGGAMELIGVQRVRDRDLVAGIVLGAGLGLAALFLYFDATSTTTTGAAVSVLFGSLFVVSGSVIPAVAGLGGAALVVVLGLQRPLLLSSLSPELAAVRGIRVRLAALLYLLAVAVAVALAALTIGAILGTALLIGPAAAALRLCRRPGQAMAVAAGLGVGATWLGIVLAYDSNGWPVSFFVVALVLAVYVAAGVLARVRGGA